MISEIKKLFLYKKIGFGVTLQIFLTVKKVQKRVTCARENTRKIQFCKSIYSKFWKILELETKILIYFSTPRNPNIILLDRSQSGIPRTSKNHRVPFHLIPPIDHFEKGVTSKTGHFEIDHFKTETIRKRLLWTMNNFEICSLREMNHFQKRVTSNTSQFEKWVTSKQGFLKKWITSKSLIDKRKIDHFEKTVSVITVQSKIFGYVIMRKTWFSPLSKTEIAFVCDL